MDFKCGLDKDGNPLRWTYKDMIKGYNEVNKIKYGFLPALIQNGNNLVKLDCIEYYNGRFLEISDIYYIKIKQMQNYKNYNKTDFINELKKDYNELYKEGDYYKCLKRLFSICNIY